MSKALEKLIIAYLTLQECANKLQADKDAMQQELADLQHRYKTLKEQKAFLQTERNKWFDAYKQIVETNELQMVEQADEMRQLKAENERLRAYVIRKDGIGIFAKPPPAPTLQELEEADEAMRPIILLSNQYGDWVQGKTLNAREQTELLFTPNKQLADQFANLDEVKDFLDDYPLELVDISYHHPETLQHVGVVTVKTE